MNFGKTAYRASKNRVIQLIKATHDWEKTEGFIADGVINPDVHALQPLRVLCILAESYGYDECGMVDIEDQPQSDLMGVGNPTVKTPRRMAALLRLLLLSVEREGAKVPRDEWDQMPRLLGTEAKSVAIHQDTLSKIAWINVKKASNPRGTKLDPKEAHSHAQRNRAILQEQIAAMAPHLMLICGRDAFVSLLHMELLGTSACEGKPWQLQSMHDGVKFMQVSHPAYFPDWGSYEAIYRNYGRIHEQLWG
ncbi:MAG: hypothetical protein Q8M07_11555 [Prosthecobacter sp.]|nr:hypothetical protein [Prosthecobacter sp.]